MTTRLINTEEIVDVLGAKHSCIYGSCS